jgi:type II secretory pathway pseudopilin PulG
MQPQTVQVVVMLIIVIAAVIVVFTVRRNRDQGELTGRIREMGGQLISLTRVKQGSPFADTTRGWWAWRVQWRDAAGSEHTAWALTTREGIKEWRD